LNEKSQILIIGCGNSNLSEKLYEDGHKNVFSIDISEVVISRMRA
jgi:2-polyprenyl-3-methyl-5-hydroxy-6-metoxy-1,4-benzoquinol methylase